MKKIHLLLLLLLYNSILIGQNYNIAKSENLHEILTSWQKDSIQKIERLAALEFHKLLNQYRIQNKKDTIQFNDFFWLTSRNHNLYMIQNNILSHTQKKGGKSFSGERPGDRIDYVQGSKKIYFWTGENCLYNYSANGANINTIAKNIAKGSFEQWKNSPGHNQNMLSETHSMHGVAFTINDYLVYGTDLFGGSNQKELITNDNQNSTPKETKKEKTEAPPKSIPIEPPPADSRINQSKIAKEFTSEIGEYLQIKNNSLKADKLLASIAQKHADYIAANKTLTQNQIKSKSNFHATTLEKRYVKEKYGIWKFLKPKPKNLLQFIALKEIKESEFNKEKIGKVLISSLITENKLETYSYTSFGVGIKIRRIKEDLSIYAVLVIEN